DRGEAGPEEREPAAKARVSSFDEREPLAVPRCQRLAGAHDRDQLPLLRILPALQSIVIDPRAHSIGPALDARVPGLRLLAEDPARMIDGPLAGDHADKLREELFGVAPDRRGLAGDEQSTRRGDERRRLARQALVDDPRVDRFVLPGVQDELGAFPAAAR